MKRQALVLGVVIIVTAVAVTAIIKGQRGSELGAKSDNSIANSQADIAPDTRGQYTASTSRIENGFAIPQRYQFLGVAEISGAPDENSLLARYSPEQRIAIESFYRDYGVGPGGASQYSVEHIFSFKNAKQLEWLVTQGFPTPDDVLAASSMSDDELKKLSEGGNFKAGAFYLQRLANRQQERLRKGGGDDASDRDLVRELMQAAELEERLASEGAAFGAYVLAQRSAASGEHARAMAGYAYAASLGDTRASDILAFYANSHPAVSPAAALSAYRAVTAASASRNARLANSIAIAKRPQFPRF